MSVRHISASNVATYDPADADPEVPPLPTVHTDDEKAARAPAAAAPVRPMTAPGAPFAARHTQMSPSPRQGAAARVGADAGIRLAGEGVGRARAGSVMSEDSRTSASHGSTLPPPYVPYA